MSKNWKSSAALLLGYGVGQGSVFVAQLWARTSGPIAAGEAVLYISLFSLCFQFADFGNSTFGVSYYANKSPSKFHSFLAGRAILSLPIAMITAWLFQPPNLATSTTIKLFACIIIAAFLFSLSESAKLEANGNFRRLAIAQSSPWIFTAIIISLVYGAELIPMDSGIYFLLATPLFTYLITRSSPRTSAIQIAKTSWQDLLLPFSLLIPLVASQLWAREMLISVTNAIGIEQIGPLGLIKSVQTAGCVGIALLIRPYIAQCSTRLSLEKHLAENECRSLRKVIFGITAISLAALVIAYPILSRILPKDIGYWLPVLICVPLFGATSAYTTTNQLILSPKMFGSLEMLGLLTNAITFYAILQINPVLAFIFADLSRLILFAAVHKIKR